MCACSLRRCARLGAAIYHMEQRGGGESRSKQVTCGGETQMGTPGLQLRCSRHSGAQWVHNAVCST